MSTFCFYELIRVGCISYVVVLKPPSTFYFGIYENGLEILFSSSMCRYDILKKNIHVIFTPPKSPNYRNIFNNSLSNIFFCYIHVFFLSCVQAIHGWGIHCVYYSKIYVSWPRTKVCCHVIPEKGSTFRAFIYLSNEAVKHV